MKEIDLVEKIERGKVVFIPIFTPKAKKKMLYKLFDKIIERAEHFLKEHPSIEQYEIDCKNLGLNRAEVEEVFHFYMGKKMKRTNYTIKEFIASWVVSFPFFLSYLLYYTNSKGDLTYSVPLLLLGIVAGGVWMDYLRRRKVKKLEELVGKIYIKG